MLSLAAAFAHLRVEQDFPSEQVQPYLNAAELAAARFMNRRVFADQASLNAAIGEVPDDLISAGVAYAAANNAAAAMTDLVAQRFAADFAASRYQAAQIVSRETYAGIVLDDLISAGILLVLGHLFENREAVVIGATAVEIPMGAQYLWMPYRVDMGV